ncbi:mRNA-decapping enzyme 1B isoform X4 [Maylandia zebra]|uniref:5'-(N(7)-methylguanosine 5'-triphospho)-[mRNA] hydrolase n=1 Tax=Astatotilapia calliptera TaxID=8154 RepID=A0A3P8RA60_ASTCA|nr:mRNA-decapping enzyme 1B isoform X3 [Maylandia zebra]XP_026004082.1 mRNA-decapping enzyme 1B-like isoform X3 [Astatotilapia calliptera]
MTATSAGSSSSLAAKGLDISLAALQRQDPYINNIVDLASQVALYTYNNRTNEWEKTEVEGTLFIYTRLASPRHGFTIMNRLSMQNLTEPLTKDLDFQLQDPFLLYRNARLAIHGIWFYDKEDCQRIAQRMKILTQQEQVLAQSQGGWLSPGEVRAGGGGKGEAKGVDIIQMLTKARTEYDKEKSTSEPKEIGGSSVLYGNPHLIKPIPVKPNTQDNEGAEPKSLSLATLFGSQQRSTKPDSDPFANAPALGSSAGKSPSSAHQQQHCPAIAKLMQGQRGVGTVGGVLQTVSESPENRLCDNGVPLEHHHHHHHLYHHQQQQHHHQHQLHPDPIRRLFQTQPPPLPTTSFSSAAPNCCSNPSSLQQNPHLSSQPVMVNSVSRSHLQAQQSQQLFISLSNSQPEIKQNSQTAPAAQGTGLLSSQVTSNQVIQPSQGLSHVPGMVSPHELLQKLQLVQQEQSLASSEPPRICPGLAPRFLGPAQNQGACVILGTIPNPTVATAGQKAALQLQVISPQRIPATVAPNLLLSPSMFTQTKPSSGLSAVGQESSHTPSTVPRPPLQEEVRILSRSQLQATLLHLIQNDSSFLDSIYEAYASRFAKDSSNKY